METRAYATEELQKLGFRVLPSYANFIFAESDRVEGGELYRQLKARGILVRHFDKPRISNFNRITIGTRSDMDAFLKAVREILGEN
jgi:histidinol-phosphate aminotransferase